MATSLFLADILEETESAQPYILESVCPQCRGPLAKGLLEVAGGETVETVYCLLNDCDLRPFTF